MGLQMYQARRSAFDVFSEKKKAMSAAKVMLQLWSCFADCDCSLAEINPLAELADGRIEALDAKIVLDDNALFRHPDLAEMRIPQPDELKELRAKEKGLSYVGLDGNIGCMVNGAGLAMATMDLVKHLGGKPANFLDIGGSSNPQKVIDAMELLLSDPGVEVIFINVFGGITRCDDVASGLVEAVQKTRLDLPLVVRLTGTNEEEGRRILSEAGIEATTEMRRGAELALQRASGGGSA
jgi:succinyl-CoA synthetase beta subunit